MINNRRIGTVILVVSLFIVIASVLYANNLARQLAVEEQRKMEIWAEATRQLILADENTDVDFISSIIEGNNTIPVYMLDSDGNVLLTRNVIKPVKDPSLLSEPIEVRISDDIVQYIYYDESTLLHQLRYFPYVQFTLIFIFIVIAVITLLTAQRSEQNRVWVGLSKETAHQLGTPISSLHAWQQLLSERYPDDELVPQMKQDIDRLHVIADRFSKVGSEPELASVNVMAVIADTVEYMRKRIGNRVTMVCHLEAVPEIVMAEINIPLFSWVLENLIKNAVDAMNGVGTITIDVSSEKKNLYIDIADTGKGIEKRKFASVFQPGYTTKKRGWGLGLSLSKRIIEDYHHGDISIVRSNPQAGTMFRIRLETV